MHASAKVFASISSEICNETEMQWPQSNSQSSFATAVSAKLVRHPF